MIKSINFITVRLLAVLLFITGVFAFVGSIFLWGKGFILNFPQGVDYVFPITDIIINVPASLIAAVGLWRIKKYGYVASQFFAGFGTYASVEIFIKVIQGDLPHSPEILIPQIFAVLLSIVLVIYLWRINEEFK